VHGTASAVGRRFMQLHDLLSASLLHNLGMRGLISTCLAILHIHRRTCRHTLLCLLHHVRCMVCAHDTAEVGSPRDSCCCKFCIMQCGVLLVFIVAAMAAFLFHSHSDSPATAHSTLPCKLFELHKHNVFTCASHRERCCHVMAAQTSKHSDSSSSLCTVA
jgi:hypothetical protein